MYGVIVKNGTVVVRDENGVWIWTGNFGTWSKMDYDETTDAKQITEGEFKKNYSLIILLGEKPTKAYSVASASFFDYTFGNICDNKLPVARDGNGIIWVYAGKISIKPSEG
jgi:hypothetical protein